MVTLSYGFTASAWSFQTEESVQMIIISNSWTGTISGSSHIWPRVALGRPAPGDLCPVSTPETQGPSAAPNTQAHVLRTSSASSSPWRCGQKAATFQIKVIFFFRVLWMSTKKIIKFCVQLVIIYSLCVAVKSKNWNVLILEYELCHVTHYFPEKEQR